MRRPRSGGPRWRCPLIRPRRRRYRLPPLGLSLLTLLPQCPDRRACVAAAVVAPAGLADDVALLVGAPGVAPTSRSEVHTSELKVLTRTSYTVLCLTYKIKSLMLIPYPVYCLTK